MKKMYLSILTALALSGLTTSQALARIFLQNNYLDPVQYVQQPASVAHTYQEKTIGNGSRVQLEEQHGLYYEGRSETSLSIRAVGGSYKDLSYLFKQINSEQRRHENADAIIMIDPGYRVYGRDIAPKWNTRIEWETSRPIGMTESTMGK